MKVLLSFVLSLTYILIGYVPSNDLSKNLDLSSNEGYGTTSSSNSESIELFYNFDFVIGEIELESLS